MPTETRRTAYSTRPQLDVGNAPRPLFGPARSTCPPRRMRRRSAGNLYSPGGCGCALLMAPVMALGVGIALALMGVALVALVGLVVAIMLTVREVHRAHAGIPVRTGMAVLIGALYLLCIPYLAFFAWFWFID